MASLGASGGGLSVEACACPSTPDVFTLPVALAENLHPPRTRQPKRALLWSSQTRPPAFGMIAFYSKAREILPFRAIAPRFASFLAIGSTVAAPFLHLDSTRGAGGWSYTFSNAHEQSLCGTQGRRTIT